MNKKLYRFKYFFACLFLPFWTLAQTDISGIINNYTAVTAINQCDGIIEVEDASNFAEGDMVVLHQAKGAVINETNSSAFGQITDIGGAGLYERNEILSILGNEITLRFTLLHNYDLSSSVQLVSVPQYEDAVVNNRLFSQAWNGTTGGIIALNVSNILTVNNSIDASGQGFRRGNTIRTRIDSCSSAAFGGFINTFVTDIDNWRGAQKGEGIAEYTERKESGRGPQANGGGGGNDHKSGGGGGAHHTPGGKGGELESLGGCTGTNPGLGGFRLPIGEERLFFGGGGGGGHANEGMGTDGGNGGGIIIVFANTIRGNGIIQANGNSVFTNATGDGAGGGGAGGTIVLNANNIQGNLDIQARGGNGGNTDANGTAICTGPGGGGSGGRIYATSTPSTVPNISGGTAGVILNSTAACNGSSNNATSGIVGETSAFSGFPQSNLLTFAADTISLASCGENNGNSVVFDLIYPDAAFYEFSFSVNGRNPSPNDTTQNNFIAINNLTPSTSVELFVNAITSNGCLLSDTISCSTTACDGAVFAANTNIAPLYCLDSFPIPLTAEPDGGLFSGMGVDTNATFVPTDAGVGIAIITYEYVDSLGCPRADTYETEVVTIPEPPVVECVEVSSSEITFEWNATSTRYRVVPLINGLPLGIPTISAETSFTQTGLQLNDMVTLQVTALGRNGCGDSEVSLQTCTAQDCNADPMLIDVPSLVCSDTASFQLEATPPGGFFIGEGIDSTGFFQPSLVNFPDDTDSVNVQIVYAYRAMMDCDLLLDTVFMAVVQPIAEPTLSCGAISDTSIQFNWSHPVVDSFLISYSINDSPFIEPLGISDSTFTLGNLMANDTVDFVLEAIGINSCGNSIPIATTCIADPCGIDTASIIGLQTTYCQQDTLIQLTAIPAGGVFMGDGVIPNDLLNLREVPVGINEITYELLDSFGCEFRDTFTYELLAPLEPPTLSCISDNLGNLQFNWSQPIADSFEYRYTINSETTIATTSDTSLVLGSLPEGQEVTFEIRVIDGTVCGGSTFASTSCQATFCTTNPPAILNLDSTYCENNITVIALEAFPTGGEFVLDFVQPITEFSPSELGEGIYSIAYSLTDSLGCPQSTTVEFSVEALPSPIEIICSDSTAQSVTFSWANPLEDSLEYNLLIEGELVDNASISDTFFTVPTSLVGQSVTLELFSNTTTACPPTVSTQVCQAVQCTEEFSANIQLDSTYCFDDINFQLVATPNTGTFSGDGVTSEGVFNPSDAGAGMATIIYDFEDERGCPFSDTLTTLVATPPIAPSLSCGNASNSFVQFVWTHPDSAATFSYQISSDGVNFTDPVVTTETSFLQNNLLPETEVLLRIQTLGAAGCGDSEIVELTCSTTACETTTINILPVDDVCLGENTAPITLMTDLPDSIDLVTAIWSGIGVSDTINGIFNPSDTTLTVGTTVVNFNGTDQGGCSYTGTLEIQINQQPFAEAGVDQTLNCRDRRVVLDGSASEGSTFRWTTVDGNLVSGTNSPTALADSVGAYFLEVSNGNCSAQDVVVVFEDIEAPIADAGVNQSFVCAGDTVIIGGLSDSTFLYNWNGPSGFSSTLSNPVVTVAGTYSLSVTDTTNFCVSEIAEVEVMDNSEPFNATLTTDGIINCRQAEVVLTASTTREDALYQWSQNNQILQNFTTESTFTVSGGGNYTVLIRDASGCEAAESIVVAVDTILPIADAGEDQLLNCEVEAVTLNGSNSTEGSNIQYEWTGFGIQNNANEVMPSVVAAGTYTLAVTNLTNGCQATDEVLVTEEFNFIQDAVITVETPLCPGETNGLIQIEEVIGGQAPYTYSFNGERFSAINRRGNLAPGNYEVVVRERTGCTFTQRVVVNAANSLQLDIGKDQEIQLGDSIQLNAILSQAIDSLLRIEWLVGTEVVCNGCQDVTVRPFETTIVLVEAEDANGCLSTASITLFVKRDQAIYIPNAISPNGDGQNEFFNIFVGTGIESVNNLRIYTRWGDMVYEEAIVATNDTESGWNGIYRGQALNPGTYVYTVDIEYFNGRMETLSGTVHLMR